MLENRPIVVIAIGYIIGIITGLYCKISIVFLYPIVYILYLICFKIDLKKYFYFKKVNNKKFKLFSFKRYIRYFKIIFTKNVCLLIMISSIISNTITLVQNKKYETLYSNLNNVDAIATIISNCKKKNYYDYYKIKIESINNQEKYKGTYLYLKIKKNQDILEYGTKVIVKGEFEEPEERRNYKGFDYKEYLKTLKIYGTISCNDVEILNQKQQKFEIKLEIFKLANNMFLKIKELIQNNFSDKVADLLMGICLGYTDDIDEEIRNNISESNLSYVLAVSGMHIGFLILGIKVIFEKILGKRYTKILTSIIIFIYMFISGFSPSVVRAGIMALVMMFSNIIYRKNDIWQNLGLSLLVLLIYNPYLIQSVSVLLTFGATIGILCIPNSFKKPIFISIFVAIFIAPILATYFHKIPFLSIIIALFVNMFFGLTFILCFIYICGYVVWIFFKIEFLFNNLITIILNIVLKIVGLSNNIPFANIYVVVPKFWFIILYYMIIGIRLIII